MANFPKIFRTILFALIAIFSINAVLSSLSNKSIKTSCTNSSINFDSNKDGVFTYKDMFNVGEQIFNIPAIWISSQKETAIISKFLELRKPECFKTRFAIFNALFWFLILKLVSFFIHTKISAISDKLRDFLDSIRFSFYKFFGPARSIQRKGKLHSVTHINPPSQTSKSEKYQTPPIKSPDSPSGNKKLGKLVLEEELAKLDALVGLEEVKVEVKKLVALVQVNQRRIAAGLPVPDTSIHLVFTGNPGTGKTTVARLIGRIFASIGLLESGHLVETDRSGLVAGWIGHTAIQTRALIKDAMGGVLFIDEAYSLHSSEENSRDFGREAIETLLKEMEDNRGKFCVIIAGYINETKKLIDSNPGLQSRFSRYINFYDYGPIYLNQIFMNLVSENRYKLDEAAKVLLKNRLTEFHSKKLTYMGNGRFVRNLFEKSVEHQSLRLITNKNFPLELITSEDLEKAFSDLAIKS